MRSVDNRFLVVAALLAAPQAAWAAGSCVAFVDDGVLVVECDDDENDITVTEVAAGVFEVSGNDGTTINGEDSAMVAGAITDMLLDLAGGEDICEVEEVVIPGTLTVQGGKGFTEFALAEAEVGSVVVDNKEGGSESSIEESYVENDLIVDNKGGFDEVKIEDTEVGGSVRIDNGVGDPVTGEGSETAIEADALIWGDVEVINRFGVDEFGLEEASVLGNISIDNGNGDSFGSGSETSAEAEAFVGGDLVVINKNGFDEFALEEDVEIAGSVWIANQAGGSLVEIELTSIGGSLTVDSKNGFDAVSLDETAIGGSLNVTQGPGGSDLLTRSTSGSGGVTVGGNLLIETRNGIDTITLRDLEVTGSATIVTGPADDAIDVTNSSFGDFSADGHSGFDSFLHARNSFPGDPTLRRFEETGPPGVSLPQLNEVATGFEGGVPLLTPAIDPAGIAWHAPSGHLFISDSEIEEVPEAWAIVGANVFEISPAGDVLYAAYDLTALGNDEPAGITYNEFDGFFYVSNDSNQTVTRYSFSPGSGFAIDDVVNVEDTAGLDDPEGIASDPDTGLIYVIDGHAQTVAVYEYGGGFALVDLLDLNALNHPGDVPRDPEGIAYDPCTGNLLLVSDIDEQIYEFGLDGLFVARFDLGDLAPAVIAPQGLTVAPSHDDPLTSAFYIADGGVDNNVDPDERDGRIYEIDAMCP